MNQYLTALNMVHLSPPKQSFSGPDDMEKTARISNQSPATQMAVTLEEMRESASTIDGILSGVYAALAARGDIANEILQLLAIGASKSQLLTEDLASIKRPTMVRN